MKKMDNNGFTLVELIATIVILALVAGIGSYAIVGIINGSKEKDYKLLISEIKSSIGTYHVECKYSNGSSVSCPSGTVSAGVTYYEVKLNDLVKYGFLKGNSTDSNDYAVLVNPNDNELIGDCKVKYSYSTSAGEFIFYNVSNTNASCPNMTE